MMTARGGNEHGSKSSEQHARSHTLRAWMGAVLSAALLLSGVSQAQPRSGPGAGEPVDAAMRAKMVDRVSAALNENYVFPDVAKKMEASIRQKLKAGAYDKIANSAELAEVLTRDLREVSKDKHLGIRYAPSKPPELDEDAPRIRPCARRSAVSWRR